MKVKISFLTGVGVGYVLGCRAGRQRYDQIVKTAREFAGRPEVDTLVTSAKEAAASLVDRAAGAASDTVDLVGSGTDRSTHEESSTQGTTGHFDRKRGTGPVVAGGVGPMTSPPA